MVSAGGDGMKLTVNGEAYEHGGDGTLMSLLAEMKADPGRVAVMVNGSVLRGGGRDEAVLSDGDTVDVLAFAPGG